MTIQNGHTVHPNTKEAWVNRERRKNGPPRPRQETPCCGCFLVAWANEDSVLRRLCSSWVLTGFAFAGAGMYFIIEKTGNPNFDNPSDKEYCAHEFWSCLFYVSTLYTTIGYGTIAPCTIGGRIFTMIYTICGIPITLVAVADIGFLLATWFGTIWRRLKAFCRSKRRRRARVSADRSVMPIVTVPKDETERKKQQQRSLVPFPLAILLCLIWIILSAFYFYVCEQLWGRRWSYFEALYYFVVSVTTVGLGDYDVSRHAHPQRTIADFVLIMIGISLFSMCINIIQYDMENLSTIISESIMEDYANALHEGHALMAAVSDQTVARSAVRKMIYQKSSWFVRLFISAGFEDRLLADYQKLSHMRLASTQTELEVNDAWTITVKGVGMEDQSTSTRDFITSRNSKTQTPDLTDREREALHRHVKRMSIAQVKRKEDLYAKLRRTLSTSAVNVDDD